MNAFTEISIILLITTGISLIMKLLKQPLVVGYILSGVIVGPYVLDILKSSDQVELFSKIGITVLLFIVGLGLNPFVIKEVGKVSLITGLGQIIFTSLIGFFIIKLFGYDNLTSIYIAIALTFSSTIIILKLLTDRGDLNKLYGKIAIGFLLVQDLVATIILLFVSTFSSTGDIPLSVVFTSLSIKALVTFIFIYVFSKYVLPKIGHFFASSQELLFVSSLSWGLGIAALFAWMGFSIEIGALLAGLALAMSPFSYEIASRMKPIRDFFIIMFFILLGSHLVLGDIGSLMNQALILSAFVLIGNPIIVLILMNILGYKRKVGFMAGLTVAQISEFSLILAAMALTYGHITQEVVTLITLVGIITIAGSTYMILYADQIYSKLEKVLKIFDIHRGKHLQNNKHTETEHESLLFGYDRVGTYFTKAMEKLGTDYIVIDFNPKSIKRLKEDNIPHRYGDAEDIDFLEELNLSKVKMIISTIPDSKVNMTLLKYYRKVNPSGIIILISHDSNEAKDFYLSGASYVVVPHNLGAHHAAKMVAQYGFDIEQFDTARNKHLSKIGN
jgi:Kef-type K+ transport system membrane component KefB